MNDLELRSERCALELLPLRPPRSTANSVGSSHGQWIVLDGVHRRLVRHVGVGADLRQ